VPPGGVAIGHSPLVKTAFFASDPNLGRILAAIGYAGIGDLDATRVRVWLGSGGEEVLVSENGGRAVSLPRGRRIPHHAGCGNFAVRVDLGRGVARATVWTCDLSYDYVKINADYVVAGQHPRNRLKQFRQRAFFRIGGRLSPERSSFPMSTRSLSSSGSGRSSVQDESHPEWH